MGFYISSWNSTLGVLKWLRRKREETKESLITEQDKHLKGRMTNQGWMSIEELILMYHRLNNDTRRKGSGKTRFIT